MTQDTEESSQFTEPVACREYILPRDEKSSDPKGWIRGNTKIGPVLEVTTSYLQGKYGVEIRIESVNKHKSHSRVRISHGLNKLVRDFSNKEDDDNEQETSEMKSEEFALKTNVLAFASRSKAKAKPRRRTSACSSARTVPIRERIWIDIEPGAQSDQAYPVAKRLSTLLRHGDLPREEDGAIEFWRLKDYLRNEFEHSQYWSDEMWMSRIAGGGGNKKRFQYCTDSSGQEILYLRPLQGDSGRNPSDPLLQDNVLIPNNFFGYIYHLGCAVNSHSIMNSGLIAGGQNSSKEWQTVFFTAVNPMNKEHKDPYKIDLNAPRLAWYKLKKVEKTSRNGILGRYTTCSTEGTEIQTRCNAIILYDTLPAYCISKVVVIESEEIIYQKIYVSPRPPPKISFKYNWMKELDSEFAGSSRDTQRIQPKSKTQLSRTVRLVSEQPSGLLTKEIGKAVLFGCESTNSRTVRPVKSCVPVSVERVDKDKDADENVDADQTRTERPVSGQPKGLFTQLEETDIDFKVSGLPHAVVKQAENFRVHELVKKIESHPHRDALQACLQQNSVYNPFGNNSKAMIRELGNVELFELCETFPKVQCSQCLLYWNQGDIYCTCGHLLVESESSQKINKLRLDALSIPHYVIKKVRHHGARHGKTEAQKEYYVAHNARKRCLKRNYEGIHDRFLRDPVHRDSQLKIGWTEQKCIEMDKLPQEDHSYRLSRKKFKRYQGQWYLTLNKSGKNAPMRLRADFRAAVTIMNRLHRESGEERAEPIPFQQY